MADKKWNMVDIVLVHIKSAAASGLSWKTSPCMWHCNKSDWDKVDKFLQVYSLITFLQFTFLSAFWSFGKACLKEKVPWILNFQLIIIEFKVDMLFWVWVNREIPLRALIISYILSYWAFRLYLFHANSMLLLGTYKEDLLLVLRKKWHICYIIPLQANSWVMS